MKNETSYKNKLQQVIEWLEASKEELTGETRTNCLFLISSIKEILN